MKRNEKNRGDLPRDLNLLIAANGKLMQHFYALPTEERQKLLDSISETNQMIDDAKQ